MATSSGVPGSVPQRKSALSSQIGLPHTAPGPWPGRWASTEHPTDERKRQQALGRTHISFLQSPREMSMITFTGQMRRLKARCPVPWGGLGLTLKAKFFPLGFPSNSTTFLWMSECKNAFSQGS